MRRKGQGVNRSDWLNLALGLAPPVNLVSTMATLQVPGAGEANESSDDEYFDASEATSAITDLPEMNHLSLAPASPKVVSPSISNISISALEGDPPEIEEDKDFHEKDDFEGIVLIS